MTQLNNLLDKTVNVLKSEGISGFSKHVKHYIETQKEGKLSSNSAKDILFINGCSYDVLPHPPRYRVKHQREQLELFGYATDEVYYKSLKLEYVYKYRAFIIFRCIYTDELNEFITLAKKLNKTVFYDIDDLVIDTKYTNLIQSVQNMPQNQKQQYDHDVMLYGKLMKCCDCTITTTETLHNELLNYVSNGIINRNVASNEMVSLSQKVKKEKSDYIKIGYFSGSITHNADFELILPSIQKVLSTYSNVQLHLVGEISLPVQLEEFKDKIIIHPFMKWQELPHLIGQMDVNLAPLENTLFNQAKSENKWVEASLVKVVTIASKVGAFETMIENHQTGILCSNEQEWDAALKSLIENKELRNTLSINAYAYCMKHCVSMYTGYSFIQQLKEYIHPNIGIAFSKQAMSGGIMVALRHACMLQDAGYDVSLLTYYDDCEPYEFLNHTFPVLLLKNDQLKLHMDKAVATLWTTVKMLEDVQCIQKRVYLVQNFETDFYDFDNPLKTRANQSYMPKSKFEFITISKWCQKWLKEDFGQESYWIANGIDRSQFKPVQRDWSGKIRILVEGDCEAAHKNVDESFKVTNELDPSKYEVWYMSYNAKPKDWYRVDKFFNKVPYNEVADVYSQCHILLKTSVLESFSYPPLEMMATGGLVVTLQNDGNKEYLKHRENCLIYEKENIEQAISCIDLLTHDEELRDKLVRNGLEVVESRDWQKIKNQIIDVYSK